VDLAKHYASTEKTLLKRMLASPFVHVDETKISIRGTVDYVWVAVATGSQEVKLYNCATAGAANASTYVMSISVTAVTGNLMVPVNGAFKTGVVVDSGSNTTTMTFGTSALR